MPSNKVFKKIFSVVFFVYPLLVFLAVKYFDIALASLVLSGILIARLVFFRHQIKNTFGKVFDVVLWIVLANNLLNLYFKNDFVLKIYPFLMSLGVFCIFAYSLVIGQPIIEKFARQFEKELSSEKQKYIWKLTLVWSIWLFINTLIALYTAFESSYDVWLIYNNLIFYIVSGALFASDLLYRKLILAKREREASVYSK